MLRRRRGKMRVLLGMNFVRFPPSFLVACSVFFFPQTPERRSECKLIFFSSTAKSKKLRREAAKRQRKLEAKLLASGDLSSLQPKIPVTQQSIDLPANEEGTIQGALEADTKREELRAAMREERRKKIKENNYLKSM
jgi:hypothetical protein